MRRYLKWSANLWIRTIFLTQQIQDNCMNSIYLNDEEVSKTVDLIEIGETNGCREYATQNHSTGQEISQIHTLCYVTTVNIKQ